jgi:hypothetical protein
VLCSAVDAVIVDAFWAKHASGTEERALSDAHFLEISSPSIEAERDYNCEERQKRIGKGQQECDCNRDPKVYPHPDKLVGQKPFRVLIQCLQSTTLA